MEKKHPFHKWIDLNSWTFDYDRVVPLQSSSLTRILWLFDILSGGEFVSPFLFLSYPVSIGIHLKWNFDTKKNSFKWLLTQAEVCYFSSSFTQCDLISVAENQFLLRKLHIVLYTVVNNNAWQQSNLSPFTEEEIVLLYTHCEVAILCRYVLKRDVSMNTHQIKSHAIPLQ